MAATLSAGRVWIGEGIGSVMVTAVRPVAMTTAAPGDVWPVGAHRAS